MSATTEAMAAEAACPVSGSTQGTKGTNGADGPLRVPPAENSEGTRGHNGAADVAGAIKAATVPEVSVPESERPRFAVYDHRVRCKESSRELRPGVWQHSMTAPRKNVEPVSCEKWICGPLHIAAQTADGNGNSYGRLLRFQTTRGTWREWAMPMHLLRGSGDELRGELLDMGLNIAPDGRQLLGQYLQAFTPGRRVLCSPAVGWCEGAFVFPAEVIGPSAADVIFQHEARIGDECRTAGTSEGWRDEIAALAVGNPMLMLGLCVAFAGPLLRLTHGESGGLHLVGDSSAGKTTIQKAAVSVWGGPDYRRSWRATANGLEGVAALHNDALLALDEISECDPRELGRVVYMLANEQGKQRAGKTGAARHVTRWRLALLSTGERTIGATMLEGGQRQKAGQGMRLLDVPVDRAHGAFDELHKFEGGQALADHIQAASGRHYGHAARLFIERLAASEDDFAAELAALRGHECFAASDSQERRAASRFALHALAGELATEYGITGWPEGSALEAATEGFRQWRGMRGHGPDERRQVLRAVADFIDRHGSGRFSQADEREPHIRERAGWFSSSPRGAGRVYLFNSGGLREALRDFDFKRALDVLEAAGVLPQAQADGKRVRSRRIDGEVRKVYEIDADALREAVE